MTFGDLKFQIDMLLTSDNVLPKDNDKVKAALKLAYIEIADIATPLKWLTTNQAEDIMRLATGGYFVRMPAMPVGTDSVDINDVELDIDSELVPAVARMMAGYIAKEVNTKQYHRALAVELMKKYDAKVREFMLSTQPDEGFTNA